MTTYAGSEPTWPEVDRRRNGRAQRLGQFLLAKAQWVALFIFVSVLAHGVEAAAIAASNERSKKQLATVYRIQQENRRGVGRIVACTSPGYICKAESDLSVQKALVHIDNGHRIMVCILLIKPPGRDQADIDRCSAQAQRETNERLAEIDRQIEVARRTLPQAPKLKETP